MMCCSKLRNIKSIRNLVKCFKTHKKQSSCVKKKKEKSVKNIKKINSWFSRSKIFFALKAG